MHADGATKSACLLEYSRMYSVCNPEGEYEDECCHSQRAQGMDADENIDDEK